MLKALDIGCGENKLNLENYFIDTVDNRVEVNPTYIASAKKLPIIDCSYDLVYSSHTLEHLGRNEIFITLSEWKRVLKDGGILWVIVPNLEWAAEKILKKNSKIKNTLDDEDQILSVLYGDQTYDNNYHKMGFVPKTLMREFELLGLKKINYSIEGYNLSVKGVK